MPPAEPLFGPPRLLELPVEVELLSGCGMLEPMCVVRVVVRAVVVCCGASGLQPVSSKDKPATAQMTVEERNFFREPCLQNRLGRVK